MKKSVLLLALSFVLVTFLNAQNDCTGSSSNSAYIAKEKPSNVDAAVKLNPKDCSKPDPKNDVVDLYSMDQFGMLMDTKPVESWGNVVPNTQNRSGDLRNGTKPLQTFSSSGSVVCCVTPPDYERNPRIKND